MAPKGTIVPIPVHPHDHPDPTQESIKLLLYFRFFLELHINGIMYDVFFFLTYIAQYGFAIYLLLNVSVVHSFLLLSSMEIV